MQSTAEYTSNWVITSSPSKASRSSPDNWMLPGGFLAPGRPGFYHTDEFLACYEHKRIAHEMIVLHV